jgi:AraC-like DNA-binding protein
MRLTFIPPRPELSPYVKAIWLIESTVGMPTQLQSLAVPDGCPKLFFLDENSQTSVVSGRTQICREGLYFVGNRDRASLLRWSDRFTSSIGIDFFPQGAYSFFGIPMNETANLLLDADTLFDQWGRQTTEQLRNLETREQKVTSIQDELVKLLRKHQHSNRVVEFCVRALKSADGRLSMQKLQRETGYTRRYLDMLFQQHVGLAPRVMAGIFRFQKFYRKWAQGQSYELVKGEIYTDYYDQAHFSKEFKRLTGYSPRSFMREISNEFARRLILE